MKPLQMQQPAWFHVDVQAPVLHADKLMDILPPRTSRPGPTTIHHSNFARSLPRSWTNFAKACYVTSPGRCYSVIFWVLRLVFGPGSKTTGMFLWFSLSSRGDCVVTANRIPRNSDPSINDTSFLPNLRASELCGVLGQARCKC